MPEQQPLIVVERTRATAAAWDDFAAACGASFWCSWGGARMWQLKLHAWFRLSRFDLLLITRTGARRKIGQCAVGVGRRLRVFSDGLVLRPEHAGLWPAAMESVLAHLGPGRYVYGSFWSTEAPRHGAVAALPRVEVAATRLLVVESIELGHFERWPDLLKSISRNVVRNARSFTQAHGDRQVIARTGLRCLAALPSAVQLRRRMYDRKQLAFSGARAAVNYAIRTLLLERYASMRVTIDAGRCLAASGTMAFGKSICFLDGASDPRSAGAGWDLMLHILEDAHQRGYERFLLGYTDVTADFRGGVWESPVRYRRDCRAKAIETSIVAFDFGLAGPQALTMPSLLLDRTDPCWTPGEQR